MRRHQRRIYNVSSCVVQGYEGVSEVTQEAFLAARQGLPSFRGEARFASFFSLASPPSVARDSLNGARERERDTPPY